MAKTKRAPALSRASSEAANARTRSIESEEILHAIRNGRVDALVVAGEQGDQVVILQGSEHPYRVLVETINDGAATLESDGTVLYANKRFMEILNVRPEKFIGTSLQSHFSPSGGQIVQELIDKARRESSQGEVSLDGSDGRQRMIRFSLNPVINSEYRNICVVAMELTELFKASEALRSNEESLRKLSARLLQLQDEERRRIARDLHDTTGQTLSVQSMLLDQLDRILTGPEEESRRLLAECRTMNKQVIEELRTVTYLLHPPLLDELGLASAIQWYVEGFSRRTSIETEVDISSKFPRMSNEVEVALFRVIQESLSNVHRYSESPKAYVHINSTAGQVVLKVGDYGKGMPPRTLNGSHGKVAPIGVGIQGMTERMRQLGGKLEITSRANRGTLVTATLPHAPL
jgi:two-component system, NarL family, sensor kinase